MIFISFMVPTNYLLADGPYHSHFAFHKMILFITMRMEDESGLVTFCVVPGS